MNRQEFIQELLNLYPNAPAFNNAYSKQKWVEGYSIVLKGNLDFDKLYQIMITEYMSMNNPPAPAWFSEYLSLVTPKPKPVIEKPIQQSPEELAEIKKIQQKINEDLQKIKDKSLIFTESER